MSSVQSWFLIPAIKCYLEIHDHHCFTVTLNRNGTKAPGVQSAAWEVHVAKT